MPTSTALCLPTVELTEDEQARFDALCMGPHDPLFLARVRDELAKVLATLPKGVGAGPSGERYEHLRHVASSSVGLVAMLDLGMQLVKGDWSDAMRVARLTA